MFGFMLFLHFTGLIIWVGSMLAILVMLFILKNQLSGGESRSLISRTIQLFSRLSHPSAIVVLISGVGMLLQLDLGSSRPLWIDVMEKGGGTIIILALILTGIAGSRLKKRLNNKQIDHVKLTGFATTISSFIVLVMGIVLIVSMKI